MLDLDAYEAENRERRKLKDAATAGPWVLGLREDHPMGHIRDIDGGVPIDGIAAVECYEGNESDALFIAATRSDPVEDRIDALCRELRAARWVVDEVRTNIEQIRERCYLQTGMMLLATLVDYDAACKDTDRDCQNAHDG